ncbi:MAG: penicillin-binding transpeptidase domain-containing protein, partial [Chloroflexota bacterium]
VSATQRAVLPLPVAQRGTARKLIVAGKTGTAQAPGVRDLPFAWFTGYAPADNPQIAVTVMLENIGEGSTFAAPLARQVFEAYFGLPIVDVPPDPKPR